MKLTPQAKKELIRILGEGQVLCDEFSLSIYGYDCSVSRARPDGVLLIKSTDQIPRVLRVLTAYKIPFVVRAGATNHAGSCVTLQGGVVLNVTGLNRILEINTQRKFAVVEPGVIVDDLQAALAPLGYFYAPDPASSSVCTLGGNLGQNASGARGMKYGGTREHVLAVEVVLSDGREITLSRRKSGPDLTGLFIGSEGTLGVFTRITVQILPLAKQIKTFLITFPSLRESIQAVGALAAQSITPRCIEAMDQTTLRAVEDFAKAGYPTDVQALLIVELEADKRQLEQEEQVLRNSCRQYHALQILTAHSEQERQNLWRGRRNAFAAMARLAPNVMVGDGTVPLSQLPDTLQSVQQILQQSGLPFSLLFHAGDGNFHPHILFDQRNLWQTKCACNTMSRILKTCVDHGGTLSGEHGIGVEKRALMAYQYERNTLQAMAKIKHVLDPYNLANPLKIIPHKFQEKARSPLALPAPVRILQEKLLSWRKEGVPFVVAGKNTRLKTKEKNILSCATLNQILDIDTTNYVVTAQAGVELPALANVLKQAGVYSILPTTGKGTLGGLFAAGILPSFHAHVLGLEVLLPDGTYVRYGGKFMKNAAGYPLTRLLAGSQGTLGLITQLTFKVFAKPQKLPKPHLFRKAVQNEIWAQLIKAFAGEENHG